MRADNKQVGLRKMINGKIKLRGKEWYISIRVANDGELFVASIRNGDVEYWAYEECEKRAVAEAALKRAFANMVYAGDITWDELEYVADMYDPNRDDAARVNLGPIRLIMMELDGSGRSVRA